MLPRTIRARTSPEAITKVTRLFNGSAADVLGELFQNARRAGASGVDVRVCGEAGSRVLAVRDDGRGIADPAAILSLGRSGWDMPTREAEDPAGMGFFALAGLDVTVRSWSDAAASGWHARIPPAAWEGTTPVAVHPDPIATGTEIAVAPPAAWEPTLDPAIRSAALYLPISVALDGTVMPRADFLADAAHVEDWQGSRIGVVLDRTTGDHGRVNFHGVVARCALPSLAEGGRSWRVLVDIGDTPSLGLVLPARKELAQGPGLDALREAAERAIFHAIARRPHHRLSHAQWSRAAALGVALPEAERALDRWSPATADLGLARGGEPVREHMLVIEAADPAIAQPAARALAGRLPDGLVGVVPEPRFVGYAWYDTLPRLEEVGFRIRRGDEVWRIGRDDDGSPESGRVDAITLEATLVTYGRRDAFTLSTDVALAVDLEGWGDLDGVRVYATHDAAIAPEDLMRMLDRAVFVACEDRDADSWDSQHDRFLIDAAEIARTILLDAEAALVERMRDVARSAFWFVPRGRRAEIALDGDAIDVQVAPAGACS